jgi:ubiquinone biosynthesis protein
MADTETSDPQRQLPPAKLRQLLAARGSVGIMLGQFLAVRPDLMAQGYANELLQLVDQAPPSPWALAYRILSADLEQPPEAAFEWLSTTPIAVGSLAQVHAARTVDGVEVAVKIQHLDVEQKVRREIQRARWIRRLLESAGVLDVISYDELIDEFERWLARELDFRSQLHDQSRMLALNNGDTRALVPRPFPALSGRRVVTSQLVHGIVFSEFLHARDRQRIRNIVFEPQRLADNMLTTVLRQVFVDRVFNADLHPGNLLALPGDLVCFMDFGLVDDLDPNLRNGLDEYVSAVYAGDIERMFRAARSLFVATEQTDMDRFHEDFVAATQEWMQALARASLGRPGERTPLAGYLIAVLVSARANHLRVPPQILSIYRALLTAEAVAAQLDANVDLFGIGRRFFAYLRVRRAVESLGADPALMHGAEVLNLVQTAPGALNRLMSDLADERFVLPVKTLESTDDRRQAVLRSRLVSAALMAVAASVVTLAASLSWGEAATVTTGIVLAALTVYVVLVSRSLR